MCVGVGGVGVIHGLVGPWAGIAELGISYARLRRSSRRCPTIRSGGYYSRLHKHGIQGILRIPYDALNGSLVEQSF